MIVHTIRETDRMLPEYRTYGLSLNHMRSLQERERGTYHGRQRTLVRDHLLSERIDEEMREYRQPSGDSQNGTDDL